MLKKFLWIMALSIILIITAYSIIKDNTKFKLFKEIIGKPLPQVIDEYSQLSCNKFNSEESAKGYFDVLVTGYCRPIATDFQDKHEFLCSVGLNCRCPAGREEQMTCGNTNFKWSACKNFDDKRLTYCDLTATLSKPTPGTVAADWRCFEPDSTINIDGKDYKVTDKGSAITGRRIDMWFADCHEAFQAIGVYKVKIDR